MAKFRVWITLVEEYETYDAGEAFEMSMNDLENRDGMAISSHEIIPVEGKCGQCWAIGEIGTTCRGCGRGVFA